jgi:hypothetical protein
MDMEESGEISRKDNLLDQEPGDSRLLEKGWKWVEELGGEYLYRLNSR